MAPPSYVGPTCVGTCRECGTHAEVPDLPSFKEGAGWCSTCETLTERYYWDGPVMVRD